MTCITSGWHTSLAQSPATGEQLHESHPLNLQFESQQPVPLAMAAGDFDEDGVGDLVVGYAVTKGGLIAVLHGNLDAHAPQTHESWLAAGRRQFSDPYLQSSKPISIATQPGLLIAADVNGDGHLDLVFAAKGDSQLYVMLGDGKGNLHTPVATAISGSITALTSYRPGAPLLGEAIVAGYQSVQGAGLSLLSYGTTGLVQSARYALPGAATAMTVASLDADLIPDVAIVAGGQLLVLPGKGAITGNSVLATLPISDVAGVVAGQFLFDRHAQLQLSVLTNDGDVVTLAHQGFDSRPFTPQEIAGTRQRRKKGQADTPSLAEQAGNNGNAPWVEVNRTVGAAVHATSDRPPVMVRMRASGNGGDDVVVLNSSQQQQTVIRHATPMLATMGSTPPSTVNTSVLSATDVIAAVPAVTSPDTRQGLMLLRAGNLSPEALLPSAGNTFFVNTTVDNTGTTTDPSDGTRCTIGSGEICTLRDAVTFVNNDGAVNISAPKSDTIMLPAGTYNLTWQAGDFDGNGNALTHLEVLGPVTIIGDVAGGTIINGNNNDEVFTINPGVFGSFNPSGTTYVFDTSLENLTIENGKNSNNPINGTTGINNVGGCINWDAAGAGNLTITNSVIKGCTNLWGPGGGIWAQNSAGGGTGTLIINGGSISNNSTPELGGGIYIGSPAAAVSITGTTITGNKAQMSVNPSDGGGDGAGGGMFLEGRQPSPATPQSTLTGVTISSNVAANDDGGGIETFTGILLSGSLISNNSTGGSGGGIWSNTAGDGSQTTITSSNFLSNSATKTGGAIAMGIETPADGNILQVSLSRIVGNTASGGASGLANGISAQGAGQAIATENWWGCNTGPTTASDGCDQAALFNVAGTLTVAPFAKLGFTSDITTIPPGGSMNLTVSLNTDSNNNAIAGAFPAVATNYPYALGVTGVTASPALTTGTFNTSGTNTDTLTPSSSGNGAVSITFDNQTDTINFVAQAGAPTATSLSISAIPSATFLYGQPSGFTVQLAPSNATGITTANFQLTVDGATNISGSPFGLILIGNNNYQISGPFNLLSPGGHTLTVKFLGTSSFATSMQSASLTVSAGTVSIGNTVAPPNPIQGQGGTINVTITGIGSGATATGSITYAFDGGATQTIGLPAGSAAISIPAIIATGVHSVSLAYSGDTNYATASTSTALTLSGRSQTTIASLGTTTATINVFGFGFTAPSGQLSFQNVTGSPVTASVTLNTATAVPSLSPQMTTSTGVNSLPVWTELADLNGDGILDLLTSVFGTDSVNVQLGNGDGTFGASTSILIGPGFGPAEVHAVSLRGNGTLDLIVGSSSTNKIAVLLGNGNGTVQSPVFYTAGSATNTPLSLTSGDFNLDGNFDIAVANSGDNSVSILLGNGSGALTPLGAPIIVGQTPKAIRAGDFNSDGYSDLAVANFADGTVTILRNNRDETFSASNITVGAGPQALAITGSGANLLLAVANSTGNSVSVMQSNDNGTFATQKVTPVGQGTADVRFADFNEDGIPDLVTANSTDGTLSLVMGSAAGTYTVLPSFPVGGNPTSAAVGDLDGDTTPDVVVANKSGNNIGVLLGGSKISVPYSGLALAAGDMVNATYTPDGASKYGPSTSPNVTVPSGPTATQAIASTTLTQNHLAASFTPVTGSGGNAPLSYGVAPGLPTGLGMNLNTGAITGTPTVTSSTTSYTVTVTDAGNATATATFNLIVNGAVGATQTISAAILTQNHAATSFTPVTGSGGTGTLGYSISPGLPAGLNFSMSTGAITGTPIVTSAAITYTVTVTDANNATATATFSLTVTGTVAATQAIPSTTLTQNHIVTPFTPVTGSGGTSSLTYSVSPTFPAGLNLSSTTGAVTGTPTAISSATTYTVTVTDANSATATATFSLAVNSAPTATQTTASILLSQNHAATPFTPVTGSGGTGPLAYSVTPTLPAGLNLSSTTGAVTGTPTAISSVTTYSVTVTDTNGATATATFSLTVNGAITATQTVGSTMLSQNHAATPFTPVTGSGGTGTLTYSVSPTLPAGLGLNSATGAIAGTPTVASGATTYTITVRDANNATASATFVLTVNGAITATQAIPTSVLAVYQAVAFSLVVGTGGTSPITYSVSPTLPAGLGLSSTTGAVTGTPTAISTATTFTVTVTDANNATATATFVLTVNRQNSMVNVAANPTSATPGQAVTLSASVMATVTGTPVTPSGTVTFFNNGTQLGTPVSVVNGAATITVTNLPADTSNAITATYSGDGNFVGSSSANPVTVAVTASDFTFTSTAASAYTAAPGAVATYSFALTPLNGSYPGPVSFTVTGLPAGAVATFTPNTVATSASGATVVQLNIQTAPASAHNTGPGPLGRGVALALLLLPFASSRRLRSTMKARMLLTVLLMAGTTSVLTGCGTTVGFLLQAPQTYTLTVTATSGSVQHIQTITLTVQ